MKSILFKLTRCDSGLWLNPMMHIFIFVTFVFSVGFIFFGSSPALAASVLYSHTFELGLTAINSWGIVGLAAVVFHVSGLLIRGKIGTQLLQFAMFCGFYVWAWAAVIYIVHGFIFQFLVGALPNLFFWSWYAWQWRRRYGDKRVAFV